tara:strand:+ start:3015 stop:3185 length:171 start_codon:yes stop_codon:yes gene_type:complete
MILAWLLLKALLQFPQVHPLVEMTILTTLLAGITILWLHGNTCLQEVVLTHSPLNQ